MGSGDVPIPFLPDISVCTAHKEAVFIQAATLEPFIHRAVWPPDPRPSPPPAALPPLLSVPRRSLEPSLS